MTKRDFLSYINRIADEELGTKKRKKSSIATRRDCSENELKFIKRKYDVQEVKEQRNGKWTVKYKR